MDRDTVNLIIDILEEKHMYDAAIEILRYMGGEENLINYFSLLKGGKEIPNLSDLEDKRRERVEYILESRRGAEAQNTLMISADENKNFEKINRAAALFNRGNYSEAKRYFKEGLKGYNGSKRPIILTYICLCEYKTEEYADALRTINKALDFEPWNENYRQIREGIIDRLAGLESKNKFIEEYYTKGTVVGEILKHSLELYNKIDNIEFKNKNFFSKFKEFISESKRLFAHESQMLQRDLMNIEQFIENSEKQLPLYLEDEEVKRLTRAIESFELPEEIEKVFRIAETLYTRLDKDKDMDFSHLIFLYSKGVEMLCREKIIPYFSAQRENLPLIETREDYNKIGIRSFDVGGLVRFHFSKSFNIESSLYLQEINKNNLLRKEFKGKEHIMPWEKLKFISHCIKTGKDPIDGTKSAGILLLFFFAYKNMLGIKHYDLSKEEIVQLSGNLIRLQNERNSLIHSKIVENREEIESFRKISFECVSMLCKIKSM